MKALVVGGNSGIGLSIVCELLEQRYEKIYVVGKEPPVVSDLNQNIEEHFKKRVCFYKTAEINNLLHTSCLMCSSLSVGYSPQSENPELKII